MPIKNYGVLKGKIAERKRATAESEHFQILLNRGNDPHRIAINTKSSEEPSQVLYFATNDFRHEITDALIRANLEPGFTDLDSVQGGIALDFIRRNLLDVEQMVPLPSHTPAANDDLNDQLDFFVQQAMNDDTAVLYAFGQHWVDTNKPDRYFAEINPSKGIHDIHMNQGNPKGKYYKDNGIWQDGCLLFHFPSKNRWAAVFTAFQSQSFSTDENGNPIPPNPNLGSAVCIIAALVNPVGEDMGKEFVILLNKSMQDVNLNGWKISDKVNQVDLIGNQVIKGGDTLRITLTGNGAQLGNKGGNITLLDAKGHKVDGASYTKRDAARENELIEL